MACGGAAAVISGDDGCMDWASTVLGKRRGAAKGRFGSESDEMWRQIGKGGGRGIRGKQEFQLTGL